MIEKTWTTYLLECADGTWYCGVTNSLRKRVLTHNAGKGAKYTRSRLPVTLLAGSCGLTKAQAMRLEYRVKQQPKVKKIEFLKHAPVAQLDRASGYLTWIDLMVYSHKVKEATMYETHHKGELAFLKCSIRALEKGMILSRPTTETRYDAILDDGGKLLRVQVKYGDCQSASSGSISVDFRRKSTSRSAKVRTYNENEIDAILVYIPRIDKVVFVPVEKFSGKPALSIRTEAPRNKQIRGIFFAKDNIW